MLTQAMTLEVLLCVCEMGRENEGKHSHRILLWAGLSEPVSITVSRPRTHCLFVVCGNLTCERLFGSPPHFH